ncbi:MAG: SUMF1/EgtB/PvdO family nonheme iron enzyme [Pseudomonadales bacterium]
MSDAQRPGARQDSDGEVIRPVAYRPVAVEPGPRLPLNPLQMILLLALGLVAAALWFLFTAQSVRLVTEPPDAALSVSGGLRLQLGDVWLLRAGDFQVEATAPGHHPLQAPLVVDTTTNQVHRFELTRLPGQVTFESTPPGATVQLGDQTLGVTPTEPQPVPAGPVSVTYTRDRYQPLTVEAVIEGMEQPQTVAATLLPDWADVTVSSSPAGAEIFIDDEPTGQVTPAVVAVPSGEHEIRLRAPGHRSHRQRLLVSAQEQLTLPTVVLVRADSLLTVRSEPPGAGITLNGRFQGESPVELAVQSGVRYRVQAFRAGYAPAERSVELPAGADRTVTFDLERLTGTLVVQAQPEAARLYVDGRDQGPANQTLTLPTRQHRIEVRLPGYAAYQTDILPREGIAQELKVRLLTVEEARLAALTPTIRTRVGQELVLLRPGPVTMGASRREPGRRANETLREVNLTRLFYLGQHEVTNQQYRRFVAAHRSGKFQDHDLDGDDQPVVNVGWQAAALYCNWLSDLDGLPRFYQQNGDAIVGVNPSATGYRLPTEAEWAWAARQVDTPAEELRFPWGRNLPPPDRHGNYADRAASNLVGRTIFGYNDNHIAAAPVGTFAASRIGLFDMAGNVAEWVHDFYEIPDGAPVTDPLGPAAGEYHVIRGSSWMHGTITELRLSFRDYGSDGRQDVGFRIARFAE